MSPGSVIKYNSWIDPLISSGKVRSPQEMEGPNWKCMWEQLKANDMGKLWYINTGLQLQDIVTILYILEQVGPLEPWHTRFATSGKSFICRIHVVPSTFQIWVMCLDMHSWLKSIKKLWKNKQKGHHTLDTKILKDNLTCCFLVKLCGSNCLWFSNVFESTSL